MGKIKYSNLFFIKFTLLCQIQVYRFSIFYHTNSLNARKVRQMKLPDFGLLFYFLATAAGGAISAAALFLFRKQHESAVRANQAQQNPIHYAHTRPPIRYTTHATIQATVHCIITTPIVFQPEFISRLMAATAATQGVYSKVNARKLQALRRSNS